AAAAQKVTEEFKGTLSPVGNRATSAKVEGCLTARPISRAGAKAGLSDPAVLDGKAVAQQIKGTPGITGLSPLSVHSGEEVWHLNTSGCYGSNAVPTSRLITVDPSVVLWNDTTRQYRGKSDTNATRGLVGNLLGDGTLRRQGGKRNALLEVNHAWKFREY